MDCNICGRMIHDDGLCLDGHSHEDRYYWRANAAWQRRQERLSIQALTIQARKPGKERG